MNSVVATVKRAYQWYRYSPQMEFVGFGFGAGLFTAGLVVFGVYASLLISVGIALMLGYGAIIHLRGYDE